MFVKQDIYEWKVSYICLISKLYMIERRFVYD